MRHLGEATSALDDERWVKARLAAAPAPQPSAEFLSHLARLGQSEVRRVPAPGSVGSSLGSQRPRGRADGVGPGRAAGQVSAHSRPAGAGPGRRVRNRCIAAAGLAASGMVGLGSGGLASGPGGGGAGIANPPTQARPSSVVETVSTGSPGTTPVPVRPLVRPQARTVLSVVYRQP
jgi:hypothetical protein